MTTNLVRENNGRAAGRRELEKFITPPASVSETADGYLLELEMPGVNKDGLEISIENNEMSIANVVESIVSLNRHERAYFAVYKLARRRMMNFYLELNTPEGRETFRREMKDEISRDDDMRDLHDLINESLLEDVITKIRLEAFYINQLLPRIIDEQDAKLRSDFLSNSGLDRFQIEELESEYFEMRAFPPQMLEAIQRPA